MRALFFSLGIVAAAVVLAAAGGLLFLQSDAGRRFVATAVENALSGPDTGVRLHGLEGRLPFDFRIEQITLSDRDGTWLTIDGAALDWRPWRLLAREVHVTELRAARALLDRLPVTADPEPRPPTDITLEIPTLPVALRIDDLVVDEVVLGAAVAGVPARLAAEAMVDIGRAEEDAVMLLFVERRDAVPGRLSLALVYRRDRDRLAVHAEIDEPAGGILASALDLPDLPPISLRFDGDGPIADWRGTLSGAAPGVVEVAGTVRLSVAEIITIGLDLEADIRTMPAGPLELFTGERLGVAADLAWDAAASMLHLSRLELAAGWATMTATGHADVAGDAIDLTAELAVADLGRLAALADVALAGAATLRAHAAGPVAQPVLAMSATGSAVRADAVAVDHLAFDLDLAASAPLGAPDAHLRFTAAGTADGVRVDGADNLQPLLEPGIAWSASGTADPDSGSLWVESLAVESGAVALAAAGSLSGPDRHAEAEVELVVADLDELAAAVGLPVRGSAVVGLQMAADLARGVASGSMAAALSGFATGKALLDQFVGTAPRLVARLDADADGSLRLYDIEAWAETITASGAVAVAPGFSAVDGDLMLAVPDLAAIAEAFDADADGTATISIDFRVDPDDGSADAAIRAQLDRLTIGTAIADAALGQNVAVSAHVRRDTDGTITMRNLVADAAALEVRGDATMAADFSELTGAMRVSMPRLAALAGALDAAIAGTATVDAAFAGPPGNLRLELTMAGRDLAFEAVRIDAADATATVAGLADRPSGEFRAEIAGGGTMLAARAAFAMPDASTIAVSDLSLRGAGTDATGDLRIMLPDGLVSGRLTARSGDLAPLGDLLDIDLAGSAEIDLDLAAPGSRQDLVATVALNRFRAPGAAVAELAASAGLTDIRGRPGGSATLSAADAIIADILLDRLTLSGEGDGAVFAVRGSGEGAYGEPFSLAFDGEAALAEDVQRLRLDRLEATYGAETARLASPATFARVGAEFRIDDLVIDLAGGRLVARASIEDEAIAADLRLDGLDLAVAKLFVPDIDVGGSLAAALTASGSLDNPVLRLIAESVDLEVGEAGIERLPPIALRLEAEWSDGILSADAALGGVDGVDVAASLVAPLVTVREPSWSIAMPGEEFISGGISVDADLGLVGDLLPIGDARVGGQVAGEIVLSGTPRSPTLAGGVALANGTYESLATGTVLTAIAAEAVGDGDGLTLRRLIAQDGESGTVSAQGRLQFDAANRFPFAFTFTATEARLVRLDEASAVVSADIRLSGNQDGAAATGSIIVESADIELPDRLPPQATTLQVVEINRPDHRPALEPREPAATAIPISLDLTVELPRRVFVRGRGVDSDWRGSLSVTGTADEPIVVGSLSVARGTVNVLNRIFIIEHGEITFDGSAVNDPALDIAAAAQMRDITVRVFVGGRASLPTITLESEPPMPSDEVLAQLLFGRESRSLSPLQAVQLAQAAAALTGRSGFDVVDRMRQALALDHLDLRANGDDVDAATLRAGKYLGDNIYIGVDQGLARDSSRVTVEIELTPNITVESDVGADATGNVGINWRWDY